MLFISILSDDYYLHLKIEEIIIDRAIFVIAAVKISAYF